MASDGWYIIGSIGTVILAAIGIAQWRNSRPSLVASIYVHPFLLPEPLMDAIGSFYEVVRRQASPMKDDRGEQNTACAEAAVNLAEVLRAHPFGYVYRPEAYIKVRLHNRGDEQLNDVEISVPRLLFFCSDDGAVLRDQNRLSIETLKPGASLTVHAWARMPLGETVQVLLEKGRPKMRFYTMAPARIALLFKVLSETKILWIVALVILLAFVGPELLEAQDVLGQ